MKLTRRQMAAAVSGTALAAATSRTEAQTPAPADDLTTARDRLKANTAAMAQIQVPMAVEPAFRFKA